MIKKIAILVLMFGLTTQGYGFGEFFTAFSEAKSSVIEKLLERFLTKSEAEEKQEGTQIDWGKIEFRKTRENNMHPDDFPEVAKKWCQKGREALDEYKKILPPVENVFIYIDKEYDRLKLFIQKVINEELHVSQPTYDIISEIENRVKKVKHTIPRCAGPKIINRITGE